MAAEHDNVGVPDDGCASYKALYEGLAELEADTHLHVHKENNFLFPAAIERRTSTSGLVGDQPSNTPTDNAPSHAPPYCSANAWTSSTGTYRGLHRRSG